MRQIGPMCRHIIKRQHSKGIRGPRDQAEPQGDYCKCAAIGVHSRNER